MSKDEQARASKSKQEGGGVSGKEAEGVASTSKQEQETVPSSFPGSSGSVAEETYGLSLTLKPLRTSAI